MLVIGNQVIAVMVAGFDKENAGAEGVWQRYAGLNIKTAQGCD